MKAEIELKGKDEVKKQIDTARQIKTNLQFAEGVLLPKLSSYEFRVPVRASVRVSSYQTSIDITIVEDPVSDESTSLTVADVVRLFGLRLNRNFNAYSGTFYWEGKNHSWNEKAPEGECSYSVCINNVSQGKCEIRKVKKMVTEEREVYEAHCE